MAEGQVNPVYLKAAGADTGILTIHYTNYTQTNLCAMIGSPSEAGLMQFDNRVIQPSRVQFTGIVKHSDMDVFIDLRDRMKSKELSELLCEFYTKAGTIENMVIESLEEIGESSRYDGVEIKVSMQEYLEHNPVSQPT